LQYFHNSTHAFFSTAFSSRMSFLPAGSWFVSAKFQRRIAKAGAGVAKGIGRP
jgi:hypothetical protein